MANMHWNQGRHACALRFSRVFVAPRGMKTYSESKIELRTLQSKCWKTQVSFCHQGSSVSRKAWTMPRKLQELKKYPRVVVAVNLVT